VYDAVRRPPEHVVIVGRAGDADFESMLSLATGAYHPDRSVVRIQSDQPLPADSPWTQMKSIDGKATAYVCRDYACRLPVATTDALGRLLSESGKIGHPEGDSRG
jgi:uncharacterized protein YyaL (SSP411 family)